MKGGLATGVLTERGKGGVTAAGEMGKKGVGMSWEESLICQGDRVAVVGGEGPELRDLGKIGWVKSVRVKEREVVVEGLNMVRCFFIC